MGKSSFSRPFSFPSPSLINFMIFHMNYGIEQSETKLKLEAV